MNTEAVEHAPYSPSTFEYRELCPCWEPSGLTNEIAERGTAIHKAIEVESVAGLTEQSDIDCALLGIKYTRYLKKYLGPFTEFRELRVEIFDQWGWIDELLITGSQLNHLVDFKSGYHGVTDAEHNPQMQGYVRGVFWIFSKVDKITVHIPLPRRQEVSSHTFIRDRDFENISERIFRIIENAKRKAYYNPGWKQCQHCGAKATCPAIANLSYEIARLIPHDLEPVTSLSNPALLKEGSQINAGLKIAKVLEAWIEAMKTRAHEYCSEGYELNDFKASPVAGAREITNLLATWELAQKYGITLDKFLECCSVKFTELLSLVGEAAPRGVKGKTKDEFTDELNDADAITVGAPKIQLRSKTKELT